MPVELEVSLDEQTTIEYPALFTEYLLANEDDELEDEGRTRLGSLNSNGWCWVIAENTLHLWNFKKDDSVHSLNLIPNSRPYNAQDIVIYERTRGFPGVMAVTSNGTLRHWSSSARQQHTDTQLNLNHEPLLSLMDLSTEEKSPCILLTTTLGSVYEITENEAANGRVDCKMLASYTSSLGSKLSTIFFGNSDQKTKRALKSLSISPGKEEDSPGEIVVLGPKHVTVFDRNSTQPAFSVTSESLLEKLYGDYFKSRSPIPMVSAEYFLLDFAEFRGGLIVLSCVTISNKNQPVFALGLYPNVDSLQMSPSWFAILPIANPSCFQSDVESSFIGQLSLLIPEELKPNVTNFWDGIIVLHPTFAQSVHPSCSLKFHEIPVNKAVFFPKDDHLIGQASDGKFAYVFFSKRGLCTVRLLPKGFPTHFPRKDKAFGDAIESARRLLASSKQFKFHDAELKLILEAFHDFSSKRIRNAERLIFLLSDTQLCDSIHRLLEEILDDEKALIAGHLPVEQQVAYRKLLTTRIVFFVKSLELEKTLKSARCPQTFGSMFARRQAGVSILCEAVERTASALAIWEWAHANQDHLELIEFTAEHYTRKRGLTKGKKYFDVFFKKLTSSHSLPTALIELVKEKSETGAFTKDGSEFFVFLLMVCDALGVMCNAIDRERRSRTGITDLTETERWTGEQLATTLQEMALIVLKAIDSPIDISSLQRKSAIDKVRSLLFFALSESKKAPEGNEAILYLYNVGELELARDLAERFKDFKLLIKIAHACENDEETKRLLDGWKSKFKNDKFDAYLYKYYRSHGMDEELLVEDGSMADDFIDSCEDLRWRRHILNDEFDKAAQNLLLLGERSEDATVKENAFTFAKLSAWCADNGSSLFERAQRHLNSLHRPSK